MTQEWDHSYDVVVAGSGAAGFAAAITAADAGCSVLILEATDRWGGSTSMSGGALWLPNNPLMRRDGAADSREEALAYLEETVGHASSAERREAFVDAVDPFVALMERLGMRFSRATDYPDYYPEKPGGKIGRAVEVEPFDRNRLGSWWDTARAQDNVPAPMKSDDFWQIARAWSTPGGAIRGARVVARTLGSLARREHKVGMGGALACSFMNIALQQRIPLWLSSPVEELIIDDARVVGVRTSRDGRPVTIRATRGVILGAGGFDHNSDLRERHHGVTGEDSSGSRGNLGSWLALADSVGAALDLMDDAWWGASVPPARPGSPAAFLVSERSMPHSIIVDAAGNRFANESESYVDLGHHMLALAENAPTDPTSGQLPSRMPGRFWMITDARHALKYLRAYAIDPRENRARAAAGQSHRASTLAALAQSIGADPATLQRTVERFNGFARTGVDHDFHRGDSAYDRYYGDPLVRPNPNLGTIERGPFSAVEVVVGDLGTKGGILTDVHGRALHHNGSPIPGLYAAGNCSAAVMGRTYPGPGATLGPAAVFGFLAARHAVSGKY